MDEVHVEQTSYKMPPQEGFTVAYFLTVADLERSASPHHDVRLDIAVLADLDAPAEPRLPEGVG